MCRSIAAHGIREASTRCSVSCISRRPGDSYISRKSVPAGTALSSEEYWAICSEYSAQVRKLEQDVDADVEQMHTDLTQTKADMSREFSETHTAMSKDLTDTHTAISQELLTTEQRIAKNLQDTTTTLTG